MPRVRTARQEAAHKARRRRRQYRRLEEPLARLASRGWRLAELPGMAAWLGRTPADLEVTIEAMSDLGWVDTIDGELRLTEGGRNRFAPLLARGGRNLGPPSRKSTTAHGKASTAPLSAPSYSPPEGRAAGPANPPAPRFVEQRRVFEPQMTPLSTPYPRSTPTPAVGRAQIIRIAGERADGGLVIQHHAAQAPAPVRDLHIGEHSLQLEIDGGEVLEFRVLRALNRTTLTATCDGTKLTFSDGGVRMRASRTALWSIGLERWLPLWLDRASQLIHGTTPGMTLEQSYSLGWRVAHLDVCSDFTGLHPLVTEADMFSFRFGGRRVPMVPRPNKPCTAISALHRSDHANPRYAVELSLSVQHKSQVIRELDKHEPNASPLYAGHWLEQGWDGYSEVWRLEFRARRSALARTKLDLRNPTNLTADNLHRFFCDAMRRYQLVTGGGVDPRWEALRQAAAVTHVDLGPPMATAARLTDRERQSRLKGKLLGAAVDWLGEAANLDHAHPDDVLDVTKAALALAREQCKNR